MMRDREALADVIFEALDAQHDEAWHVHASECCWPFPGIFPTICEVIADVVSQARREGATEALQQARRRIDHEATNVLGDA